MDVYLKGVEDVLTRLVQISQAFPQGHRGWKSPCSSRHDNVTTPPPPPPRAARKQNARDTCVVSRTYDEPAGSADGHFLLCSKRESNLSIGAQGKPFFKVSMLSKTNKGG